MNGALHTSTLSIAEGLLSQSYDGDVRLRVTETLRGEGERHFVVRCQTTQRPSGAPPSVIIKRAQEKADDPQATRQLSDMLFNEWASLQFLSELDPRNEHAPDFICGDIAARLIVMEDLQGLESLVGTLLGDDSDRAEEALMMLARRLGQMHAATVGKAQDFERIRDDLGAGKIETGVRAKTLVNLKSALARLSFSPGATFYDEAQQVLDSVLDPGPFQTFVHGDPCPDNCLIAGPDMRLIDFESAGFRHALVDGVYGRTMFPTCWCSGRIPRSIVERMESDYRSELVEGCGDAADDRRFYAGVVEACAFWLLAALAWSFERVVDKDVDWGTSTVRRRILARLETFAEVSETYEHLPNLRSAARALSATLRIRWPVESAELPLYPAFR